MQVSRRVTQLITVSHIMICFSYLLTEKNKHHRHPIGNRRRCSRMKRYNPLWRLRKRRNDRKFWPRAETQFHKQTKRSDDKITGDVNEVGPCLWLFCFQTRLDSGDKKRPLFVLST